MNKGTPEGTKEEISFVKKLNKKEDISFWDILKLDSKNCYAIHVISHKQGIINNTKIKPKADAYIARGEVSSDYLLSKNYYLDENDIAKFNLIPIDKSGISIKRKDSYKYQILKMNPVTFEKIFKFLELGAGASIYCVKSEELKKNYSVLTGWKTTWEKFVEFFKDIENIELINDSNADIDKKLKVAKAIKKKANGEIEELINTNSKRVDFIFQGIGNFEEPFTVYWFYELGTLKKAGKIPFVVTTGSGRSKGDFTIVIKPKNLSK
jgi:hypothetical protein